MVRTLASAACCARSSMLSQVSLSEQRSKELRDSVTNTGSDLDCLMHRSETSRDGKAHCQNRSPPVFIHAEKISFTPQI